MSLLFLNTCLAQAPAHQKLENDLQAFLQAGGKIEVLPGFGQPGKLATDIFKNSNGSFFTPKELSVKIWKL